MKMKTFRFLHGETKGYYVHFGEVRDTKSEEGFTFMYLRGSSKSVKWDETDHALFLCPKYLDLVIVGQENEDVDQVLKEILTKCSVGTLVLHDDSVLEDTGWMKEHVKKIVRLTSEDSRLENKAGHELQNVPEILRSKENRYCVTIAGWDLIAEAYGTGTILLFHGLSENEGTEIYDDCVMCVKAVDSEKCCVSDPAPDGYGCALGCTLHQDFDVCKFRKKEKEVPFVTGVLVLPELSESNDREYLPEAVRERIPGIRFLGLPGTGSKCGFEGVLGEFLKDEEEPDYKKYVVGLDKELDDRTIAEICRAGMYRVPVVLKENRAVCCSGLLKYTE